MDFDQQLAVDFIAEHWARFVQFCEERGEDPQKVYEKIGGKD